MPKRTDANQQDIIDALRDIGASVQDLHTVGKGCPDLLVGYRGVNYLLEVKHRAGKLTGKEPEWHADWRGQVCTVWTVEQAIFAISELDNERME